MSDIDYVLQQCEAVSWS